jgi:purine-binding chemotaxis protein CheW
MESSIFQVLTFRIAGEEYAVGILSVREIIEYEAVTRVPATPVWIRGVINLRGSVVPVIDLAVKLGLPETRVTRRTCIVIVEAELEGEPAVLGILVDSVHQVIELTPGEIEPPPAFGTPVRADFLLGMAKTGPRFALLLDIVRVLAADELLQAVSLLEEVPGEEAGAAGEAAPA